MSRRSQLGFVALWVFVGSAAHAQTLVAATDPRCVHTAVLVTIDGGTGSGTMIDPRGYVLTNNHVVAPVLAPGFDGPSMRSQAHVRVQIPSGSSLDATDVYEAEIVAADATIDLALVRITGRPGEAPRNDLRFDAIAIADGEALETGTTVHVLGYPFGNRLLTVLDGTITGRREQTDGTVEWVTTDAPFNPGNSGGSVVDGQCRLVGVPTQVYRGGLNPVNMARPIDARARTYIETARTAAARRATQEGNVAPDFGPRPGATPDKIRPSSRRERRAARGHR